MEYVHQELNKEVQFLAGYYVPMEEELIKYDGRDVLVVSGKAVVEASCCGSSNTNYALVPGFVESFKSKKNDRGLEVSTVEPVKEQKDKLAISEVVRRTGTVNTVDFW